MVYWLTSAKLFCFARCQPVCSHLWYSSTKTSSYSTVLPRHASPFSNHLSLRLAFPPLLQYLNLFHSPPHSLPRPYPAYSSPHSPSPHTLSPSPLHSQSIPTRSTASAVPNRTVYSPHAFLPLLPFLWSRRSHSRGRWRRRLERTARCKDDVGAVVRGVNRRLGNNVP